MSHRKTQCSFLMTNKSLARRDTHTHKKKINKIGEIYVKGDECFSVKTTKQETVQCGKRIMDHFSRGCLLNRVAGKPLNKTR